MKNLEEFPVTCGRLDFLNLLYVKYQVSELDWPIFKRKVEAVNELFSWDIQISVQRKTYKRIGGIEPVYDLNLAFLKLVRARAFTGELQESDFPFLPEMLDKKTNGHKIKDDVG